MAYYEKIGGSAVAYANLLSSATNSLKQAIITSGTWDEVGVTSNTTLKFKKGTGSEAMAFEIARSAANSPILTIRMSNDGGTTFTGFTQNIRVVSASTYAGNIEIRASVNANRLIIVLSTISASGVYTNHVLYLGKGAAFDTADSRFWGFYVSSSAEASGRKLMAQRSAADTSDTGIVPEGNTVGSTINAGGVGYGVLETFIARSIAKGATSIESKQVGARTNNRSTKLAAFMFADLEGYDGSKIGYNGPGVQKNTLTGKTGSFTGTGFRDLFEEEKFLGSRMKRIGIYREYDGHDGSGLRGTLDGLYHVTQMWHRDNAGSIVPKSKGKAPLAATVYVTPRGEQQFGGETDWVVVPLSNSVKNFYIYNGLSVVAFPKIQG